MPMTNFFATCPKNLEGLLEQELLALGATTTKQTLAGVSFTGDLAVAYRACLWSRLANRILLPLGTYPAATAEELYENVRKIAWEEHLGPQGSLLVDFAGQSSSINNTHFGAQKVKDAVVDTIKAKLGERPSVNKDQPTLRINAYLYNEQITISIDLAGGSLHKRGYRLATGEAPIKENLAAALLLRANWPAIAKQGGTLVDPLCGSGTLLIEGALMAADIAPGLLRSYYAFTQWPYHQAACWEALLEEAKDRREQGLINLPDIRGYDASPKAISQARINIEQAGLDEYISVIVRELTKLEKPTHGSQQSGLIITNPPYGERLSDAAALEYLYRHLADKFKEKFNGWQAGIITGNPELGKKMGLRAHKQYSFFNGSIPCKLLLFNITPEWFVENKYSAENQSAHKEAPPPETMITLTAGAQMVANRLQKNLKSLAKWLETNNIECYRLYDADMPEYAAAIDYYKGWVYVQEYAPPKTIPLEKSQQRLDEIVTAIPTVLKISPKNIVVKQRRKQTRTTQYQKYDVEQRYLTVNEDKARFLVNLHDYIDTGLFLDHRPIRKLIHSSAQGKAFLNLFCYTGTASVQAALGGARNTTSVDMSTTYLNWAKRNFALNGLGEGLHKLVQMDCLAWLKQNTKKFDLILLDPPTFSNSKRMTNDLDIQRDHVELIEKTMASLNKDGLLIFSTHQRTFKLDVENLRKFSITDISKNTIDKDFARDTKIHYCWEIRWWG